MEAHAQVLVDPGKSAQSATDPTTQAFYKDLVEVPQPRSAYGIKGVGEIGLVTKPMRPFERGEIRLQKPVAGSETWEALSEEEITIGERVRVLDVEGHILKVRRAK